MKNSDNVFCIKEEEDEERWDYIINFVRVYGRPLSKFAKFC